MIIDDINNLKVEIEGIETSEPLITVIITYAADDTELGTLRIRKDRYDTFLLALGTMIRENYSFFEDRQRSISRLENQTTGTIQFVEE